LLIKKIKNNKDIIYIYIYIYKIKNNKNKKLNSKHKIIKNIKTVKKIRRRKYK